MKKVLLGDIIELAYGKSLPQRSRVPGRFPVFGSNGQVDTHNKYLVGGPGVIIGRKGSVGEIIWSKQDFWPIDTTYYVKLKNPDDDLRYWYYVLKTLGLNKLNSHSAIPGLNRDVAYIKQVPLRSTLEQEKIANILGSLDEKIELNRRMNETLEQLGQALFCHYFVDNPAAKNWSTVKVGDVLSELQSGSRPRGGAVKSGVPSVGAENIVGLGKYDYSKEKYISEEFFNRLGRGVVNSGDVLLYKDGAYVGKKSLFMNGFPHKKCAINEHVFILRTNSRLKSQFFLYFWLDQPSITKKIIDAGVKAAQPGINQSNVNSLPILLPPEESVKKFDNEISPIMGMIFSNAIESNQLAALRDLLLQKLISGEIEV